MGNPPLFLPPEGEPPIRAPSHAETVRSVLAALVLAGLAVAGPPARANSPRLPREGAGPAPGIEADFGFLHLPVGEVGHTTDLDFHLTEDASVRLVLYDLGGHRVRVLFVRRLHAGTYLMTWDGRDDHRRRAPWGIYVALLRSGERIAARKVILIP